MPSLQEPFSSLLTAMQEKSTSPPLIILYTLTTLHLLSYYSLALNQEGLILQEMKHSLTDPAGSLTGWSNLDANPCSWTGVTCNRRSSVVSVLLPGAYLFGPFPVVLCRLPSLSNLSLSNNYINESLPISISSCRSLVHLDLSQNLLVGPIPATLSDLHFLRYLNLEANNFSGEIPSPFGHFRRLETLILTGNLLNGTIPSALSNITTLRKLFLAYNPFSPGPLAPELGNLTNLEDLWLSNCHLVGPIPVIFGRLSRLKNLDVSCNELTGQIPSQITQMRSIVQMELYNNSLNGTLPAGFSDLTQLRRFDASMNKLTGIIPNVLCELPLESLNLYENQLEGILPDSIAKSPNLYELKIFKNQLRGTLPSQLGKNSPLQLLDVSSSNLSGGIPEFLCRNGALEDFILMNNAFSGTIPANLGTCRSLQRVRLRGNRLHGEVPVQFWGLPQVYLLELSGNAFSGNISNLINGAKNLSTLAISENRFSGSIPNEIGLIDTLIDFSADSNELSGEIPSTILNLKQLGRLDLSNNELSGRIPTGIQYLKLLNELNLANNHLSGRIPDELGNLSVLNYLDLSNNSFSGGIPFTLQNLKLNKLNLSANQLLGDIPPLFANRVYRDSFLGNPGLCVYYNSSYCNPKAEKTSRVFSWFLRSIFVITGLIFLFGIVWFLLKYKKLKEIKEGATITNWTSFHKLRGFSESEISNGLKETNVIGRGASGKVYKVVLSKGEEVAVKKLHERSQNDKNDLNGGVSCDTNDFEVEVETLGKIRHKNIVRLWCCCDAGDCKLLMYEFMCNGSLGDLLHGNKSALLDWPMRFKIALDAAEGLSYLHHDCVQPIVHRDLKSNNLLLDEYFGAKISDFGIAKVKTVINGVESMSVIAGSYGYIAPEYAYSLRVNEKSDIYSFGIVILELVTRKQPTDPEFGGQDLATWVCTTLDREGVDHVIDPDLDSRFNEHICKVLDIGLVCSSSLPTNRPSMRRVVTMLRESGATMPTSVQDKNGKLLPSF